MKQTLEQMTILFTYEHGIVSGLSDMYYFALSLFNMRRQPGVYTATAGETPMKLQVEQQYPSGYTSCLRCERFVCTSTHHLLKHCRSEFVL